MPRRAVIAILLFSVPLAILAAVYARAAFGGPQIISVASTAIAVSSTTPTSTPTPTCPANWGLVRSPLTWGYTNRLNGVVAVSANDTWAVGAYGTNGGDWHAFIMRWNGIEWSVVASPSLTGTSELMSVAVVSANDIWAVGYAANTPYSTLIEHWDGSQWSLVTGASVPAYGPLNGVAAVSANDVWAVGTYNSQMIIEHWNGSQWSLVPSPGIGFLTSVAAISADDVWAVGYDADRTLTVHWNGTTWSVVPSPNGSPGYNHLFSVSGSSTNDVWAVGEDPGTPGGLALHWDGAQWTRVTLPPVGGGNTLRGVAAISSNDVWVVGSYLVNTNISQTLTMHWNGSTWTSSPSPNKGTSSQYLHAVAAASSNSIFAVGQTGQQWSMLTLRYSNFCPTPTTTATPMGTITPLCEVGWNRVSSPNITGTELNGITVVSPIDIWIVGNRIGINYQTVTMHWNGLQWNVVPSPNPGIESHLRGVTALASNDVWAVGNYVSTSGGPSQPLVLHWDGIQWAIVSASTPNQVGILYGVSELAPDDVWAVGRYGGSDAGTAQMLIMHWNGVVWSVVPTPSVGIDASLHGVTSIAPNNIWAVGYYKDATLVRRTLTMHWDGLTWAVVPSLNNGTTSNQLEGIAAISADDIWAVGYYYAAIGTYPFIEGPITLHWDGIQWNLVPSQVDEMPAGLVGVAAVSPSNVWAVGVSIIPVGTVSSAPRIMRWNGSQWSVVPVAGASLIYYDLRAIDADPMGEIWSTGSDSARYTLTTHYYNPCVPTRLTVGHAIWQGRPAQPDTLQQLPITLTLKSGNTEMDYPAQTTSANGSFTVTVSNLPNGTYNWRAKGPKYLANSGTISLTGAQTTSLEIGLMRVGDCNNDNAITVQDFNIEKLSFGKGQGESGYDARADFDGNDRVNVLDFNLLKVNFGQGGAPPIGPG